MPYNFPVYRKGRVFKTQQLVSVKEAGLIAKQIEHGYKDYGKAFKQAVQNGNGRYAVEINEKESIRQVVKESYIFSFPSISFRLNGFSIESRNSLTVCMHKHQSKVWT